MSERDETTFLFRDAREFANFLEKNAPTLEKIKEKAPMMVNFVVLAKALAKKPCSCTGVDVEKVMKKRRTMFVDFYIKLFSKMKEDTAEYIKEVILETVNKQKETPNSYVSVTMMNEDEVVIKI